MYEGGFAVKRVVLLFLIVFNATSGDEFVIDHLYYRWMGGVKFNLINKNINYGRSIKKPEGTWQVVGEVILKNSKLLWIFCI